MGNFRRVGVLASIAVLACTSVMAFASSGCDDFGGAFDEASAFDSCRAAEGNSQVDGVWKISGQGQQRGCQDDIFNGDISLGSQGMTVIQSPPDGGSGKDRIQLNKPIGVPGGEFTLNGEVEGSCISFQTQETGSGGPIVYRFLGNVLDNNTVSGTFTVDGPNGCQGDGSFAVDVKTF